MTHKQDRHNCSVLVNLKLFMSNLTKWRVHLTGAHLPVDCRLMWEPPPPQTQRLDEDTRDLIVSFSNKVTSSEIAEILSSKTSVSGRDPVIGKKRVAYFVSSMRKRRRERDYEYADTENNSASDVKSEKVACKQEMASFGQLRRKENAQNEAAQLLESETPAIGEVRTVNVAESPQPEMTEDPSQELMALYHKLSEGQSIIQLQQDISASPAQELSGVTTRGQHSQQALEVTTSHHSNMTIQPLINQSPVAGTSNMQCTIDSTVDNSAVEGSAMEMELPAKMTVQDMATYGDLTALLLAAYQQQ